MLRMIFMATFMLLALVARAEDDSIGLEFPVEDAKALAQQGEYVFVGLDLEEGLELPGLNAEQAYIAKRDHKIRLLNYRWKTFTNIEEREMEFLRIQKYANRYNLTMWQEMKKQQRKDLRRYSY